MRPNSLMLAVVAAVALSFPAPSFASSILLLSSGDASNDAAIQSALQAAGDTVTIGPTYNNFTGAGLAGYNAVFLNPAISSSNAPDMPVSGQQALINFVSQGGGLVAGAGVAVLQLSQGDFSTLGTALPAMSEAVDTSNSPLVFTSLTSDPAINAGLPSTFSFTAGGDDTEHFITPKAGATAFFSTNQWTATFGGEGVGYGAVGWNVGTGRVLSLSTFSDNVALGSSTYDQMLANSINWAGQTPVSGTPPLSPIPGLPVPEPTSLAVLAMAAIGWLIASRTRRPPTA